MTDIKNIPPPTGTYSLSGEEYSLDQLGETLGTTIKHDTTTKKIFFINTLLNYTEEDQQNVAFNSPSSTGKSFIAIEALDYFPSEDIEMLSYTSPTAFFHSQSALVDENLSPLQPRKDHVSEFMEVWKENNPKPASGEGITEWNEKRRDEVRSAKAEWEALKKYYLVDLEKRILVFLDQPHDDLLKKLRPLLSHDKKRLQVKITDKSAEGGHKTKDIIILGYPTVIFLSVNTSLDAQERTRNLLLSAEVSQPKIRDSITQTAERLSDRKAFNANLEENSDRFDLKYLVQRIKECDIEEVLITVEDRDYITDMFLSEHSHLEPRHMRDFPRLIACIKGHALLNLFNRQRTKKKVWGTRHDCEEGYQLYREVGEANEQDIPPHIYKFWIEELSIILTSQGLTRKEVTNSYRDFYKTRIGSKALKRLIETLGEAGLVYEDKDPNDKRYVLIYPLDGQVEDEAPEGLSEFMYKPEEDPPARDDPGGSHGAGEPEEEVTHAPLPDRVSAEKGVTGPLNPLVELGKKQGTALPPVPDSPASKLVDFTTRLLERNEGSMMKGLFFGTLYEAHYHQGDVEAVLGDYPQFVFTEDAVYLRKSEERELGGRL